MEITKYIQEGNLEKLEEACSSQDFRPESKFNEFSYLWIAINGTDGRPKNVVNEYPQFKIVETLLKNKCDPNGSFARMTLLYVALYHHRLDIGRLLLIYGADPNKSSIIKNIAHLKRVICKVPLDIALERSDLMMVKLLVSNGAVYNRTTIKKIKRRMKNTDDNNEYNTLNRILKYLKTMYTPYFDSNVEDIKEKDSIKLYNCHFPYFDSD